MLADDESLQGINDSEWQLMGDDIDDGLLDDVDETLKPMETKSEEEDLPTGNWFSQSVHRVRRSINRLFGSDDNQERGRRQQRERSQRNRDAINRQKELRRRQKEDHNRWKQMRMERQLEKQRLVKRTNHVVFNRATDPRKRASDLYDENEASGYHEEDTTLCKRNLYDIWSYLIMKTVFILFRLDRTYFVVNEPYDYEYRDRESVQFQNLQKLLDDDLRNFFHSNYEGNDDEEQEIRSTLERVEWVQAHVLEARSILLMLIKSIIFQTH